MRIAVPAADGSGLDSAVSGHFGSAPYFVVVDTDGMGFDVIPNGAAHHGHGMCQPMAALAGHPVDAVVASGMGSRALESITASGARVFFSAGPTVREAAEQVARGEAPVLSSTCGQHHHGGGCGH
jgi:predicted Fe-Mo cluster-binding NifX family protein